MTAVVRYRWEAYSYRWGTKTRKGSVGALERGRSEGWFDSLVECAEDAKDFLSRAGLDTPDCYGPIIAEVYKFGPILPCFPSFGSRESVVLEVSSADDDGRARELAKGSE